MVNPTTVHKIKPSLDDMVYCANCGAGLIHAGQRYYCPNNSADSGPTVNRASVCRPPANTVVNELHEQASHG